MRLAAVIVGLTCVAPAGAAVAAQPMFSFTAATDRRLYVENAANEIFVEARIRAPEAATLTDLPVAVRNVAFVLDRSGSMAGERIAALRRALVTAVHQLAPADLVSVVWFGSEVETLIAAQPRDQVHDLAAHVAEIAPEGGAALYDALNQGAAQLRRHARAGADVDANTIDHLVLVSDGPATKGPREFEDFVRLAEVFAREGITVSALGFGPECEEDLLAALARAGGGKFHYVAQPAQLDAALLAEVDALPPVVARDVVITIEFGLNCDDVQACAWAPALVEKNTVTYRLPRIVAGRAMSLLASASIEPFRARFMQDIATARVQWRDAAGGELHEQVVRLPVYFTTDLRAVRDSVNAEVLRAVAEAWLREGLQDAIEQIDRGDFRLALRELRRTREAVLDLNYALDDAAIGDANRSLAAYIAELETRGMDVLDRKVLRAGLSGRFDPPVPDDRAEKK